MERYQELVGRNKVCFKNCSFDISICPDAILTYGMLSSAVPSCSPAHILYQKKKVLLLFSKLWFQMPMCHSTQHKDKIEKDQQKSNLVHYF